MAAPVESPGQASTPPAVGVRRGGTADPLPRGPSRQERELWEIADLIQAKIGKLPPGVEWQQLAVIRTAAGLRCRVTY